MESGDVRLARLEEGMVSVKGDTSYMRKKFDDFTVAYWKEMIKISSKVAGVSALTSLFVGLITAVVSKILVK